MSKRNPNETLGVLLAAEADFLNGMGYTPHVSHSVGIYWKQPNSMSRFTQEAAVARAKKQITSQPSVNAISMA